MKTTKTPQQLRREAELYHQVAVALKWAGVLVFVLGLLLMVVGS